MGVNSIIYGDLDLVYPSHMNFGAFFLNKLSPSDKPALINANTNEIVRFKELVEQIVKVSSCLMRMGVQKGDVIAICSENRHEFFVTMIAAMYAGAVVTFLNSAYSRNEMVHTIGISKPKYVFLSPNTFNTYYEIMKDIKLIKKFYMFGEKNEKVTSSFNELIASNIDANNFKYVDFKGREEIALILYSSGTTGLPKGVQLTHKTLITSGLQKSVFHGDLNYLSVAPWSNTVGLLVTMKEIMRAQTCIYLSKFIEKDYLQAIQQHKAGTLLTVPPLLVILSKSTLLDNYDVSSIELIYCGGAPLDEAVIDALKKRFPKLRHVLQGYGMTESCGAVTEEIEDEVIKQGSVGKVVAGNIVKIVDIETRKILGPNQPGELCIKGPVLFAGYIGKDINYDRDEDGFYKTGDVAYYDENEFFHITDRLKELIKYNAWQVAPSELEGIILQHPAVKDVGVVGVPDQLSGELPTAFVVKKPGVKVTEKEIQDFVANKVSHWKQLRGGVRFVDEIPKTASGKILRRVLRDALKPKSKL